MILDAILLIIRYLCNLSLRGWEKFALKITIRIWCWLVHASECSMKVNGKTAISRIKKKVLPILKRHSVKRAAIFGSFARGDANSRSDVDFLIEYKSKKKSLFDLVDLKSDLEESLDRKVDVITYNSIYWRIRDRILAEQVVIL